MLPATLYVAVAATPCCCWNCTALPLTRTPALCRPRIAADGCRTAVEPFAADGMQVLFGFGEKTATKSGEDPAEKVVPEGRASTNEAQQVWCLNLERPSTSL